MCEAAAAFGKSSLDASRRRRLARLRATALPTRRLDVKPSPASEQVLGNFSGDRSPGLGATCRMNAGATQRRPLAAVAKNSERRLRRTTRHAEACSISGCEWLFLPNDQAERRFRPFARRRAKTRRPPTVAERERKPCRRLRTRLLGWNVRFTSFTFANPAFEPVRCIGCDGRHVKPGCHRPDPTDQPTPD